MITELARACKYLQMITNLQRVNDSIIASILEAPIRLIEISVDSDHKEGYERSRVLGDFDRLLRNLETLKEARARL